MLLDTTPWQRALDFTLSCEGGYSNHPADRGGETFRGISRKNFPAWPGWTTIDQAKAAMPATFKEEIEKSVDLLHQTKIFYRKNFWDVIKGDELPGKYAAALFDTAVNSGARTAIRMLQTSLGVTVDGIVGPQTIKAANEKAEAGLVRFLANRTKLLHSIMDGDPSQEVWAMNWFVRVFRLANVVLEGSGPEFS